MKKGNLAALIIEKIKAKDSPKSESPSVNDMEMEMEEESEDSNVACEVCMEDFLSALEAKDAKGMASALMDFLELADQN